MPDIFDSVDKGDLFDLVSEPEPIRYDESGIPSDIPAREKKRFDFLSQMAAEQKSQADFERSNRLLLNDSATGAVEGALTAASLSPSGVARAFERGLSAIPAALRGEETFTPMAPVVSGFLNPEIEGGQRAIKIPEIPGGDSPFTQIPAGIANAAIEFANIFTTPEGILSLGLGGLPKAQQQAAVGVMAANMAANYPKEFSEAIDAAKAGDLTTATKKIIATPLMSSVMSRAAVDMPNVPKVPEFPTAPSPDVVARNLASPGTVRPTEQRTWSAPVPEAPSGLFSVGEVPFERLPRFGGLEAPRIIPKIAADPVRILEPESAPVRGGELGIRRGAESPVVEPTRAAFERETQQAIEQAKQTGLSEAAKAAEEVSNKTAPYRKPVEFTEQQRIQQERRGRRAALEEGMSIPEIPMEPIPAPEGMYPPEGMPTGTLSNLQRQRILSGKGNVRSNVRNNPPQPKEPNASEIASPTEVYGNVRPLQEPAQVLPAKESGAGVQLRQGTAELRPKEDIVPPLDLAERVNKMTSQEFGKAAGAGGELFGFTEKARAEGAKATDPASLNRLYEMEQKAIAEIAELRTKLKQETDATKKMRLMDELAPLSSKKQFFSEAIEEAVGVTEATKKGMDAEQIAAAREAAGVPPTPKPDLIAKLESLKVKNEVEGRLYSLPHPDAIKSVAKGVWNDALDIAIAAVKAGRAVGAAINEAVAHIKRNVSGFDEAKIRQNIDYILKEETKAKSVPKTEASKTPDAVPNPPVIANLEKVRKVFDTIPEDKPKEGILSRASEAIRTGFSSKFRPTNKLAEDVANAYGKPTKDLAGKFEALKGVQGKSKADLYRFREAVSKKVEGSERQFSEYLFMRRTLDRLNQDLADIKAETARVSRDPIITELGVAKEKKAAKKFKPNRRSVGDFTIPEMEANLSEFSKQVGPEKMKAFESAADAFQKEMDAALRLQVESGRMSEKQYKAIKNENQFYATFRLLDKIAENDGKDIKVSNRIDTKAKYTQAMKGIKSDDFRLGDMLLAAESAVSRSRNLAEKNFAMQDLAELSIWDTEGRFIKRLKKKEEPPKGFGEVSVFQNGREVRYSVPDAVANALHNMNGQQSNAFMRMFGSIFRASTTTFNIPFQTGNIPVDAMRALLISKTGLRLDKNFVKDAYTYPYHMLQGLASAWKANMYLNKKYDPAYLDYLDSGVSGATVQKYLTPEEFTFKPTNKFSKYAASTLNKAADLANAIEEINKIAAVQRAKYMTGAKSGKELAKNFPEMVTEVRRYAGSPDFGRQGATTEQLGLNQLQLFFNARVQGNVADYGRLFGADGAKVAGQTWIKLAPIALGALAVYYRNHKDEKSEADFKQIGEQERKNYWLLPKGKTIKGEQGQEMMDYWRIPKRDTAKFIGNSVEAFADYWRHKDPENFMAWLEGMFEDISPVNVQGGTMEERLQSLGSGLNPALKMPLELGANIDLYRHREIVPDWMMGGNEPELEYRDTTPQAFIDLAEKMPDVAPRMFRSPIRLHHISKTLTGSLMDQWMKPRKQVEGREGFENLPFMKRLQRTPFVDTAKADEEIQNLKEEGISEQLRRTQTAKKIMESGKNLDQMIKEVVIQHNADEKLAERVTDMWMADQRHITFQEKQILALPTPQRAKWMQKQLEGKTPERKAEIIQEMAEKRILTRGVANEMVNLGVEF